ncbi:MAG: DUF2232 domain-containing protein [Erysipelothrix sp.]|nr:DUF2232 domain-containing protein [Erysipelothrix sp.]
MNRSTRSLTQGAITGALTVILILANQMTANFLMSFIPLPLIIYGMEHGFKNSIITYVVCVLLVAIVPGDLPTTVLMITYGIVGLVYVMVVNKNISKTAKFIVVSLGNSINYILLMYFFGTFFGLTLETTMLEIETFLKVTDPALIWILSIGIIVFTIILETFIIFYSSQQVKYMLERHRK